MGWSNQLRWSTCLISKLKFTNSLYTQLLISWILQLGALKAGVSIVTFDEKDNIDAVHHALSNSDARGLLFSPQTVISKEENGE